MRTKQRFDAQLPATPCDAEMRARMQARAAAEGKSLAELQRDAFALFLRRNSNKLINSQHKLAEG